MSVRTIKLIYLTLTRFIKFICHVHLTRRLEKMLKIISGRDASIHFRFSLNFRTVLSIYLTGVVDILFLRIFDFLDIFTFLDILISQDIQGESYDRDHSGSCTIKIIWPRSEFEKFKFVQFWKKFVTWIRCAIYVKFHENILLI